MIAGNGRLAQSLFWNFSFSEKIFKSKRLSQYLTHRAERACEVFFPSKYFVNSWVSKTVRVLMPKSFASHQISLEEHPCIILQINGFSNKNLPIVHCICFLVKASVSIKNVCDCTSPPLTCRGQLTWIKQMRPWYAQFLECSMSTPTQWGSLRLRTDRKCSRPSSVSTNTTFLCSLNGIKGACISLVFRSN